jgi:hypothetical protein
MASTISQRPFMSTWVRHTARTVAAENILFRSTPTERKKFLGEVCPQNETPKMAPGDRGPESHFRRPIATTSSMARANSCGGMYPAATGAAWMGREDSNLRISESKFAKSFST